VVLSGARQVKSSTAFVDGWVEPQDLSVQRAVLSVTWRGLSVLDYCAGGGGKALAVAALGAARIVAHDADPRRMVDIEPRAARAGAHIEVTQTANLGRGARFDVVLCDVPCSGSGTWRRDPEAKWRLMPTRLDELTTIQAEILDAATSYVAAGGRIVYMTCSLFEAENEAQIARFLAGHPDWSCVASRIDTPLSASDGFFHAVLQSP
jgi:16S rRNA (cytosine967-C5)-methyltransferase